MSDTSSDIECICGKLQPGYYFINCPDYHESPCDCYFKGITHKDDECTGVSRLIKNCGYCGNLEMCDHGNCLDCFLCCQYEVKKISNKEPSLKALYDRAGQLNPKEMCKEH